MTPKKQKTKQERKDEAYKEYEKIINTVWEEYKKIEKPAFKEYEKKCKEIDNEPEEIEQEIIHNGRKYKLIEEENLK